MKHIVNKNIVIHIAFCLILLVQPLLLSSCTEYRVLNMKKGIAHFSVTYPRSYILEKVEINKDYQFTNAFFRGPRVKGENGQIANPIISIYVQECDEYNFDISTFREHSLQSLKTMPDYWYMEASNISMGGIIGQQVVVHFDISKSEFQSELEDSPLPLIKRTVFFQSGHLLWKLSLSVINEGYDENNIVFNDVLASFSLLDK